MPWNSIRFMQELNKCGNQYEADNAWFRNDWGERRQYALNAWRLYQQASTNALGMLLLGSAKIRKDAVLVSNFGMDVGRRHHRPRGSRTRQGTRSREDRPESGPWTARRT
jgi:hypothetical protein